MSAGNLWTMPCKSSLQRNRLSRTISRCCVPSLGLGSSVRRLFWPSWGIFPCFVSPNNYLPILALTHLNGSREPLLEQKTNFPSADRRMHAPRCIWLRTMLFANTGKLCRRIQSLQVTTKKSATKSPRKSLWLLSCIN